MNFKNNKLYLIIFIFLGIIVFSLGIKVGLKQNKVKQKSVYKFILDSVNKYEITTDFRWLTMQNDGGSNTNIYYQIDLDNNIVTKVEDVYQANLKCKANIKCSPKHQIGIIYQKYLGSNNESLKKLLTDIINNPDASKEPSDITDNFNFWTIKSLDLDINIYDRNIIKKLNDMLEKIDNYN